jgi:tRNA G18 (ribose-2'-O)-methylase SpoU
MHEAALEPYRDLRTGPGPGRFIVEGALALERLLASERPYELESIVCTPSQRARLEPALAAHLQEGRGEVPIFELSRREIAALAGFDFHRGVLACARRPPLRTELEAWEIEALRLRERVVIVVAEALADPRNLGALLRNAAAFSADLVVVDAGGADLYSRLAIRASVGNVFRLPTVVSESLPATVAALGRELPAELLAATPDPEATPIHAHEGAARQILLVGNEGAGLSPQLLELADRRVRIPVAAASDSLNVAAATAVLLYELSRPR